MDFIYDNYVWFIVIGVILFMALIGYIAEKTNFGRKKFEEKVEKEPRSKKTKKQKKIPKVEEEIPKVEEEIPVEPPIEEDKNEEIQVDSGVVIEDDDWMQSLSKKTEIGKETTEIIEETFEENEIEPIMEVEEEPIDKEISEDIEPIKVENIVEPNIEEAVTETVESDETDEGAWKF